MRCKRYYMALAKFWYKSSYIYAWHLITGLLSVAFNADEPFGIRTLFRLASRGNSAATK